MTRLMFSSNGGSSRRDRAMWPANHEGVLGENGNDVRGRNGIWGNWFGDGQIYHLWDFKKQILRHRYWVLDIRASIRSSVDYFVTFRYSFEMFTS